MIKDNNKKNGTDPNNNNKDKDKDKEPNLAGFARLEKSIDEYIEEIKNEVKVSEYIDYITDNPNISESNSVTLNITRDTLLGILDLVDKYYATHDSYPVYLVFKDAKIKLNIYEFINFKTRPKQNEVYLLTGIVAYNDEIREFSISGTIYDLQKDVQSILPEKYQSSDIIFKQLSFDKGYIENATSF